MTDSDEEKRAIRSIELQRMKFLLIFLILGNGLK
jgi:hypothetical protein